MIGDRARDGDALYDRLWQERSIEVIAPRRSNRRRRRTADRFVAIAAAGRASSCIPLRHSSDRFHILEDDDELEPHRYGDL